MESRTNPTVRQTRGLVAFLLGLALLAASCGNESGVETLPATPDGETEAGQADPAEAASGDQTATTVDGDGTQPTISVLLEEDEAAETSTTVEETTTTTTEATTTTAAASEGSGVTPDCSSPCNVVLEGDSLTMGLRDLFCLKITAAKCINSGVGGNRLDQMMETARNDVDLHAGDDGNDVLFLWAGTNDFWQKFHSEDPTANAQAVHDLHADYINERRANGWDYIFVLTHPPSNPEAIQGATQLNELLRENTIGADAIIDVGAEPKLADPFDTFLRAEDAVHYTDNGRFIVIDDHLIPAFNSLTGS